MASKRVLDIVTSLLGLALSLPITIVAAILVKASSRGPVLFRQTRVGQDGRVFKLIKFRTMY
ncbi:MAG TPA: undecaprenyl-phosphate glucose phosphotransferase, partial [Marinobacter hydrocarbonoclasticus]|nr:undecaprenyl-phosphate glucose phosphotransferase [Marinobacter nauticus]